MFFRRTVTKCHTHQLDPACDRVGAIVGHPHHRLPVLITVFHVPRRIAQRAGRAFPDRFNDLFSACAIGVYPGLMVHPEHCFETIGAEPRVGTDAAIVVDGDPLAGVTGTLIPAVVSGAPIGEAIGSMCTVAERLAAGTATAAEGYPSNRGTRLAIGTAQGGHRGWRRILEEA